MFQRIITENWLLLSLELIVIFFADLRCIAREFKIRIFKNYSCGKKNYIFFGRFTRHKIFRKFEIVWNAHFLQISAVENKITFFLYGSRGTKRSRD